MAIDFTTGLGPRALERLENDELIWLTTTGKGGQPNPNPVWFIWKDGRMLILSNSKAAKVRAMRANPRVSLSFNSNATGGDIIIFNGIADADEKPLAPEDAAAYIVKYREGMERLGMTPEAYGKEFDLAVMVELTRLRGFE